MSAATPFDAIQDITRIIHGKPAAPLSHLPLAWNQLAGSRGQTGLSDAARSAYVEAAQLFAYHDTRLAMEAMTAIARDFDLQAYPDLGQYEAAAENTLQSKTVAAVSALFQRFGHDVPAAFYNLFLAVAFRDDTQRLMPLFKDKDSVTRDHLWDAVLHAALLVTPVGLYVQSVFSQHELRFIHVMDCGCNLKETVEASFDIALDADLEGAYLQNMIAAALEQYGVNADTSGKQRGF